MVIWNRCHIRLQQHPSSTTTTTVADRLIICLSQHKVLTNQMQIKLYEPSHQRPKICLESAVVQFRLFYEDVKFSLSTKTLLE